MITPTGPDLRTTVESYLAKFPVEAFNDPGGTCLHYGDYGVLCSGSYYPNSCHSGFNKLNTTHEKGTYPLPKTMVPLARARLFLGYGINEMRDFVARREHLYHSITIPGTAADVFEYPYSPGSGQIEEIVKSQDEELLGMLQDASGTVRLLHDDMRQGAHELKRDLGQLPHLKPIYAKDMPEYRKHFEDVEEAYVLKFEDHVKAAERDLCRQFKRIDALLMSRAQQYGSSP
jgi:hypothetical protein